MTTNKDIKAFYAAHPNGRVQTSIQEGQRGIIAKIDMMDGDRIIATASRFVTFADQGGCLSQFDELTQNLVKDGLLLAGFQCNDMMPSIECNTGLGVPAERVAEGPLATVQENGVSSSAEEPIELPLYERNPNPDGEPFIEKKTQPVEAGEPEKGMSKLDTPKTTTKRTRGKKSDKGQVSPIQEPNTLTPEAEPVVVEKEEREPVAIQDEVKPVAADQEKVSPPASAETIQRQDDGDEVILTLEDAMNTIFEVMPHTKPDTLEHVKEYIGKPVSVLANGNLPLFKVLRRMIGTGRSTIPAHVELAILKIAEES